MILEKNTVTVTKEAIKKYSAHGAIVLQILYDKFGGVFELDITGWREDELLDFITEAQISATLTKLRKDGHISIEGNTVYVHDRKKRIKKEESKEEKPDRKENPAWEMAVTIQTVTKVNPKLVTPHRYLKVAKRLVKAGYKPEFILTHYGNGGWWYKEDFRGQKGQPPNQGQIENTIHLVGQNFTNTTIEKSGDNADSVFR